MWGSIRIGGKWARGVKLPSHIHLVLRFIRGALPQLPHTSSCLIKSRAELCYDRRSVGQFVLVSSTHMGPKTRFLLLSDNFGFVDVGRPLSREDRSVVYSCYWSSPAQSFSGPGPAILMTTFYCLIFETPPASWRAYSRIYIPQEQGGPVVPSGTGVLFHRLLQL
jgi:hypothetical protein